MIYYCVGCDLLTMFVVLSSGRYQESLIYRMKQESAVALHAVRSTPLPYKILSGILGAHCHNCVTVATVTSFRSTS